MNGYLEVLKKYADFNGRARRKEYWYFFLITVVISFALTFVDLITGTFSAVYGVGLLGGIYTLAVMTPYWAVSVRRLHDTGRSGWWFLLVLVPFLGALAILVLMALDSQPGDNEYGPNPKGNSGSTF